MFLSKLSGLRGTNYHFIYTKVVGLVFFKGKISLVKVISSTVRILPRYLHMSYQGYGVQQISSRGQKRVITVFLREVSALLCVYYQPIHIEVTKVCF